MAEPCNGSGCYKSICQIRALVSKSGSGQGNHIVEWSNRYQADTSYRASPDPRASSPGRCYGSSGARSEFCGANTKRNVHRISGRRSLIFFWRSRRLLGDIEEFVTGHRENPSTDLERVLATVLFTDIIGSTRSAAEMGDQAWRRRLDEHDLLAKQVVAKHRGALIKTTGDVILATFDGPARAVRCALAFGTATKQIGLPVRAGIHTGEIEMRGSDIGGIAVHAAARVMAQCQSSEVLVSRVVTDLVAGAGLKFSERGAYELKGLPGRWDLFAAAA